MITINDIARQAGVSRTTVSFVLNKQEDSIRISEKTRDRVLQAAKDLGYRPNSSYRAIRTGRFSCIALLLSSVANRSVIFSGMIDGIYDCAAANDQHVILAKLSDAALTNEEFVPKFLREWMSDGMLIHYTDNIPAELVQLIEKNKLPAVWINSNQTADCVRPDDFNAGKTATEYMLQLKHTRIAFITNSNSDHYSVAERCDGYVAAMREAGLTAEVIGVSGHEDYANWMTTCRERLSRKDRPTALIGFGATPIENAAVVALSLGLRIPEDLSLVTFEDHVSVDIGLPLTTLLVPEYNMGRSAVAMLNMKINDPHTIIDTDKIPFTFDAGATSGPCPTS